MKKFQHYLIVPVVMLFTGCNGGGSQWWNPNTWETKTKKWEAISLWDSKNHSSLTASLETKWREGEVHYKISFNKILYPDKSKLLVHPFLTIKLYDKDGFEIISTFIQLNLADNKSYFFSGSDNLAKKLYNKCELWKIEVSDIKWSLNKNGSSQSDDYKSKNINTYDRNETGYIPKGYWGRGSSIEDVRKIEGEPTKIIKYAEGGEIWEYGESRITFFGGVVYGFTNRGNLKSYNLSG